MTSLENDASKTFLHHVFQALSDKSSALAEDFLQSDARQIQSFLKAAIDVASKNHQTEQLAQSLTAFITAFRDHSSSSASTIPPASANASVSKPAMNGVNGHAKASEGDSDLKVRMERVLAAVARGEFVVVVDGEERENEGDLIIAAEHATPERLAFMVNETSGLICVGVEGKRAEELELPQMVAKNTESHGTAFTVSVDYKIGTSTGISAGDRSATIRALADPHVSPADFSRPGHMFPLRAKDGGVLVRPGHTESSVDLARLAGCFPAGAMCEIVEKDGSMMRPKRCHEFAAKHGLQVISIADIVSYRKLYEHAPK
jgi:3,4-dihydroxy 2-butanone 4-phosphate synthase/GTP cyclohydrolase II